MLQPSSDTMIDNSDGSGSRSSETSKSSLYRAMLARTGSTVWRDNARSKLAAGIEEGSLEQISLMSESEVTRQNTEDLGDNESDGHDGANNLKETVESNDAAKNTAAKEVVVGDSGRVDNEERYPDLVTSDTMATEASSTQERHDEAGKVPDNREEPEIIFRNWEPTEMEDVELGGESDAENQWYGECKLDNGAFEKYRAKEQERKEKQRRRRFYLATSCLVVIAMLLLISWIIASFVNKAKQDVTNQVTIQADTMNAFMTSSSNPLITSQNAIPVQEFTGHFEPLMEPEVSYGNDGKVTLEFPVNVFVPQGSSMLHKVYDGPECSNGARDITGDSNYVEGGLYSAGPVHRTTTPAERMGLFLQWDSSRVSQSPLYSHRSDPAPTNFSPSATMNLCVGLAIVDAQGMPAHFTETYIITTWTDDNRLREVHMVPITTDST